MPFRHGWSGPRHAWVLEHDMGHHFLNFFLFTYVNTAIPSAWARKQHESSHGTGATVRAPVHPHTAIEKKSTKSNAPYAATLSRTACVRSECASPPIATIGRSPTRLTTNQKMHVCGDAASPPPRSCPPPGPPNPGVTRSACSPTCPPPSRRTATFRPHPGALTRPVSSPTQTAGPTPCRKSGRSIAIRDPCSC